jgi:hypothetical protein
MAAPVFFHPAEEYLIFSGKNNALIQAPIESYVQILLLECLNEIIVFREVIVILLHMRLC